MKTELQPRVFYISVKTNDDLYALLAKEADRQNVPLGELLVRIAAERFKRPDLAFVPRGRAGRPRQYGND